MSEEKTEMITIAEASKRSGIPLRTLTGAAKSGKLKTLRKGPPWITTPEALEEYKKREYIPRPREKIKKE